MQFGKTWLFIGSRKIQGGKIIRIISQRLLVSNKVSVEEEYIAYVSSISIKYKKDLGI